MPPASVFKNFAGSAIVTVFVIMTTKMSTRSRPRVKAAQKLRRAEGGRLMSELINAIVFAYFPLRAIGDDFAVRVGQTSAEWGLLRTLRDRGDMTVAKLARSRPVARQWIQRLADRLAKERLIEFAENPNHLRSKLMRISPSGLQLLDRIAGRYEPWVADLASEFDLSQVRSATLIVTGLRERLMQHIREARNANS
jgi:DNA-binding MarR family transcriptional regulator